jgi:fatty-acyl-CoA synthase
VEDVHAGKRSANEDESPLRDPDREEVPIVNTAHFAHWPAGQAHELTVPATSLFVNLDVSARRHPDRAATIFYDSVLPYSRFLADAERLAGFLQQDCGVRRGDRVLLYMQNSPQWMVAFYAILRADAVVVPLSPALVTDELRYFVADSGAKVAVAPQDLFRRLAPLVSDGALAHVVVATYSDSLTVRTELDVPDFVSAPMDVPALPGVVPWREALAAGRSPRPHQAGPADHAVMPYTSGTTGRPKGCVHTHRSTMFTAVASPAWINRLTPDTIALGSLPFFHVTGMQSVMNGAVFAGHTLVILPRWDRDVAGRLISRYRVSVWTNISTMVVDFLANPHLGEYDLSSLRVIAGGGAAMPAAVAQRVKDLTGVEYMEGYGLSETMAPCHINPLVRPKKHCLGVPIYGTDARVLDVETRTEVPRGKTGEIVVHGPQVLQEYWNDPAKTAEAFIELDGKRFFRTGDLGYVDEEGYFFFSDRLKRMINCSGMKVWPAEVESILYGHPDVQECCIIAAPDAYRGETVKAVIVLKPGAKGDAGEIEAWCREKMAAYKIPRRFEFVDALPKSPTGKVAWRALQEKEAAQAAAGAATAPSR